MSNDGATSEGVKVDLQSFSKLTGFPIELIKEELMINGEEVELEELRKAMISLIDSTMLENS
ncbi:MAG: hypothetical protein JNM93_13120 [Bacteriovoracaceae bacterium]|nr:hypothetical protein [Bacteriovoracaceae bacterium]